MARVSSAPHSTRPAQGSLRVAQTRQSRCTPRLHSDVACMRYMKRQPAFRFARPRGSVVHSFCCPNHQAVLFMDYAAQKKLIHNASIYTHDLIKHPTRPP